MGAFDTTKRWKPWSGEADDEPVSSSRNAGDARSSGVVAARGGATAPAVSPKGATAPAVGGSSYGFNDVYARYQRPIWRQIRRMLADAAPASVEGIHQEVFLTMYQQAQKANAPPDNPAATLFTITKNKVRNYLRWRARRPRFAGADELAALPAPEPEVEATPHGAERKALVHAVLAKLPPEMADLIRWLDLGGMTREDVAEMLGRPIDTVKTQHRRARARFQEVATRLYKADLGGGS